MKLTVIIALQSLAFPEMNLRENDVEAEAPETCAWILKHETYTTWLAERKDLLWIKGKVRYSSHNAEIYTDFVARSWKIDFDQIRTPGKQGVSSS